jgi:nitroreductase
MTDGTEFADLVRRARSTRRFVEADPIPEDVLRELVNLARLVPCGANLQPLRYRIVAAPAERDRVFPCLRWAAALKEWRGPAEGERPTGYIVLLAAPGLNPDGAVGIAGQTIQLGATAMGYAACMMTNVDREGVHRVLALPRDLSVTMVIALGRAGETIVLEEMPEDGNTAYWRTPDQVHHVPKRSLDEVLIR